MDSAPADDIQVFYRIPDRFPRWPSILDPYSTLEGAEKMLVKLICHPPLGQPTVVPATADEVVFRVALEVHASSEKEWEVALWHDGEGGGVWTEGVFEGLGKDGDEGVLDVKSGEREVETKIVYFVCKLARPKLGGRTSSRFTIKFRHGSMQSWKWVNEQFGWSDGLLLWQPEKLGASLIERFLDGLDPVADVELEQSETPDTLLWSIKLPVPAAEGPKRGSSHFSLGTVIGLKKWFATCRLYNPWFIPRHGKDKFVVDKDVIQAAFLREDGLSVIILGLSGMDDTAAHFRNDDGKIIANIQNDADSPASGRVLVAVSKSFDIANASVFYHARKLSSELLSLPPQIPQLVEQIKKDGKVNPSWYEEWVDGFGYCTWNSLGQGLTQQKILDSLDSFRKDNIIITTLIIDDNWQSLDNGHKGQGERGMTEFEADKAAFPDGMKGLISKIKSQNPTINRVAVWHTILGYWGAISPNGEISKKYKTVEVSNPYGWKWTCVAPEDIDRFYADFYQFLQSCGVDGVKTDAQMMLDDVQDAPDRRTIIKSYQDAWTLEGLRYLSARQISCGSQVPVIMFHSMLSTSSPRIVVRNSDDFFPTIDSSHAWHIFTNAHNALIMQHFNVLLDWDMFQSDHPYAAYHAAARCISGGPVYITDYPDKHNKSLIKQMTATTPSGSTVILRPQNLAKSSNAYNGYDEARLLKVDTYHGRAETGVSIVGVFNVSQYTLSEILLLSEFPGTEIGSYIIRSYVSGKSTNPLRYTDDSSFIHIDLEIRGWDILSAHPVTAFRQESSRIHIANLGLLGKMSGSAAIISTQLYEDKSGRVRLWTSLKALGTWGIWLKELPDLDFKESLFLQMFGQPVPLDYVKVSERDERVLEVDLEKFWKEGGFSEGWSNEVAVELLIK